MTSFIGRDRELQQTAAALGEARVVTLIGVGGVGKTRLALQAAGEVLPRFGTACGCVSWHRSATPPAWTMPSLRCSR